MFNIMSFHTQYLPSHEHKRLILSKSYVEPDKKKNVSLENNFDGYNFL